MATPMIAGEHVRSPHVGLAIPVEGAPCQSDPDAWFPDPGNELAEAKAKAGCAACVFRPACLAAALATQEPFGVWGGLTERERRHVAARTARAS